MQFYKDINGRTNFRDLVGTSGTTYGNTDLFEPAEITAMLADGISIYNEPEPPALPTEPEPTTAELAYNHLVDMLTQPLLKALVVKSGIDFTELLAEIKNHVEPPAAWESAKHYTLGDLVTYDGGLTSDGTEPGERTWVALSDVKIGVAPDYTYEADGSSGGWMPV